MPKIVVVGSSMPPELAIVAVASVFGCLSQIYTVNEIKDEKTLHQRLKISFADVTHYIFVGEVFSEQFLQIWRSTFEKSMTFTVKKHDHPTFEIIEMINVLMNFPPAMINGIKNSDGNMNLLRLLDDRYNGRNHTETEVLFAALYNMHREETGGVGRSVVDILTHAVKFEDAMMAGKSIVEVRRNLAMDRAVKNSCTVTLKNGQNALITCSSDLINQSHEALMNTAGKNERIACTITAYLVFDDHENVGLRFSLREQTGDSDAKTDFRALVDGLNAIAGANTFGIGDTEGRMSGGVVPFKEFMEKGRKMNLFK